MAEQIEETEEERALAEIAVQRWQHYQDLYRPLEDILMEEVRMDDQDYQDAEALQNAEMQSAFSDASQRFDMGMARRNVDPTSGAFMVGLSDMDIGRRASSAAAQNAVREDVADLHYDGLQHIVNMGLGVADDANLGLGELASNAQKRAADSAFNRAADSAAMGEAVLGIGGAVAAGYDNEKDDED